MPIRIACPKCKTSTTLPDAARGKKASVKCGKCGFSFVVGLAPAAGAGQAPPRTGAAPQRSAATQRAFGDLHPARRKSPVLLVLVLLIVVLGVLGGGGAALWFFVLEDQFKPKPVAQNDSGGNGSSAATKPDSAPGGGTKPTPPDPTEITAEALKEWQTKLGQVSDAFLVVYYDVSKTHLTNGSTASYIYKGPGETVVLLTSPPPAPVMKVIEARVKEMKIDDPAKFKEFEALASEGKNCDAQKALDLWKEALSKLEPKPPAVTVKEPIILPQPQPVSKVALSRDGKTLAVSLGAALGQYGSKVKVYDLAEGKEKYAWDLDPESGGQALAISPDGKALAVDGPRANPGMPSRIIKLYDLETGNATDVKTDFNHIASLAFSPDGKALAVGPDLGRNHIKVFEVETGKELFAVEHRSSVGIRGLAFSSDGKTLVTAGSNPGPNPADLVSDVKIWDAANGQPVGENTGITGEVKGLAISADGKTIVLGTRRGEFSEIHFLDGKTFVISKTIPKLKGIEALALTPDDKVAAMTDYHGEIHLLDLAKGEEIGWAKGHDSLTARTLSFSGDGRTLASGAGDKKAIVWDRNGFKPRVASNPPDPPIVPPVETFKDPITLKQEQVISGLLLTPDGKTLIVGMRSHFTFKAGKAILIDLAELKEKKVFQPGNEEGVMVVALSPDGKTLVTDGAWMPGLKQGIRLYDLESGKDKEIMTDQKGTSALAISPDGKQLVVGSKHIKFWDIATGQEGKMITEPHNKTEVGHLAFTPDGKLLVSAGKLSGGQPGDIKVFDAATCELKHHLKRLPEQIAGIAITADGQKLVAAGSAPGVGAVAVWDLATGTELKHVPQLKQMVGMALAPGGRFVALGDVDPTIQIIDLETSSEVNLLKGHKNSFVRSVVFTPDGKTLISGALHEVLIWDRPLVPRAASTPTPPKPPEATVYKDAVVKDTQQNWILLTVGGKDVKVFYDGDTVYFDAAGKKVGEPDAGRIRSQPGNLVEVKTLKKNNADMIAEMKLIKAYVLGDEPTPTPAPMAKATYDNATVLKQVAAGQYLIQVKDQQVKVQLEVDTEAYDPAGKKLINGFAAMNPGSIVNLKTEKRPKAEFESILEVRVVKAGLGEPPPVPMPDPKEGAAFLGTWEGMSGDARFKVTMVIAKDKDGWKVDITFKTGDQVAGAAVGKDVKVADGQLTFVREFTKKPDPSYNNGTQFTLKPDGDKLAMAWKIGTTTGSGTLAKAKDATPTPTPMPEPSKDAVSYKGAVYFGQVADKDGNRKYTFRTNDGTVVHAEPTNKTKSYDPEGKEVRSTQILRVGNVFDLVVQQSIDELRLVKNAEVPSGQSKEMSYEGAVLVKTIGSDLFVFKVGDKEILIDRTGSSKVLDAMLKEMPIEKAMIPGAVLDLKTKKMPEREFLVEAKLLKGENAPAGPWAEVVAIKGPKMNLYNLGVAASPDGKQLALTMGDVFNPEFTILDVATKKPVKSWKVPTLVQPLIWSADGASLAGIITGDISGRKSEVIVWDAKTWEQRAAFKTEGSPSQLALSGDGNVVAAAKGSVTDAGFLKAWDVTAKKEIFTLELKTDISKIALSTDGKALACNHLGPQYDQIVVFDLPSGKQRVSFKASYERIALSADGNTLVGSFYDSDGLSLTVWDLKGAAPKEAKVIKGGKWRVDSFTLIDKDRHVVLGGGMEKDEVRVYDLRAGTQVHTFAPSRDTGPGRRALIVRTIPDSSLLLTYGTDETVRLWTTPFGGKGGEK